MLFRVIMKIARELIKIIIFIPYFKFINETKSTQVPIKMWMWFFQKIVGINRFCYWPTHPTSTIICYKKIYCGIETSPGYMPSCYIQGEGGVFIGDYSQIGPNVGIVTAGHGLQDNREVVIDEIRIGRYCWIGMGAIILPGVVLGDYTIVGAGSVVTSSFEKGYCVIAGSPAKEIKKLNPEECIFHKSDNEYHGYIHKSAFDRYRKKYLYLEQFKKLLK